MDGLGDFKKLFLQWSMCSRTLSYTKLSGLSSQIKPRCNGGDSFLLFRPMALVSGLGSVGASLCHRGFHKSDAAALKYLPRFLKQCKEPLGLFRCYA